MIAVGEQAPDFTISSQALDLVLSGTNAADAERVEALALQGRNEKIRWRAAFAAGG